MRGTEPATWSHTPLLGPEQANAQRTPWYTAAAMRLLRRLGTAGSRSVTSVYPLPKCPPADLGRLDVVGHLLAGGGGQHVAANHLHLAHQAQVGAVAGGLEAHVLQQVGHACESKESSTQAGNSGRGWGGRRPPQQAALPAVALGCPSGSRRAHCCCAERQLALLLRTAAALCRRPDPIPQRLPAPPATPLSALYPPHRC